MTLETTYEHNFITRDKDAKSNPITFNMIEDESGDVFWGYGHQLDYAFIAEVNRWLSHVGIEDEQLVDVRTDARSVRHLYAKMVNDEYGDRFKVCELDEDDPEIFPVTRLML
jgi:hypothetical protein